MFRGDAFGNTRPDGDIEAGVNEALASLIVTALSWYAAAGLAFAGPFVWRGVGAIDPAARQGTWGFRVLIVPGVVIFWPLLVTRWVRRVHQPPTEHTAHRRMARRRPA